MQGIRVGSGRLFLATCVSLGRLESLLSGSCGGDAAAGCARFITVSTDLPAFWADSPQSSCTSRRTSPGRSYSFVLPSVTLSTPPWPSS
ncbi:hypothetical protein DAEQUDRAFT_803849 [Daedalea quercina L-15889]|uniref:Secreted protein n=1 Tax=Daedalea quercina L-15889 TaxID=1314783 RepID=A0A165LT17_9APHY|nr:hypothetical protein DAEQUDRAFT_803849 [Daedalea quercina L-15889]